MVHESDNKAAKSPKPETDTPPAGPHADEKLTNRDATPGAGSLPDDTADNEADVGSD